MKECVAVFEQIMEQVGPIVKQFVERSRQASEGHALEVVENEAVQARQRLGEILVQTGLGQFGDGRRGKHWTDAKGDQRVYKRVQDKTVVTLAGVAVVARAYYWSKPAGGACPLDASLGLPSGQYSRGVQLLVAQEVSWMPFERVTDRLNRQHGVPISKREVLRIAGRVGQEVLDRQKHNCEQVMADPESAPVEAAPARLCLSADAGKVRTLTEWRDLKNGIAYEVDEQGDAVGSTGYVSRIDRWESFAKYFYAEAVRSGLYRCKQLIQIADGADWIWNMMDDLRPDGCEVVQVIDWYHMSEHLWQEARAVWPKDAKKALRWVKRRKTQLMLDRVDLVIRELKRIARLLGPPPKRAKDDDPRVIATRNVKYFRQHAGRMLYGTYRKLRIPIGSGPVESACRQMGPGRLKGPGMFWSVEGAQRVAALRALQLSGRWERYFSHAA